jgi:hemerythrin-like domain-containing protein
MLPIAPLMIEHRLIERMIAVIGKEVERIEGGGAPDPAFIDEAIDFIHTYADRCHHGKEEDILFRELAGKELSPFDRLTMEGLIEDHRKGRENVARLIASRERYLKGEKEQTAVILEELTFFVNFYPKHIEKEDKHFFMPSMSYFSEDDKNALLNEERTFDRDLIHRLYKEKVTNGEKRPG